MADEKEVDVDCVLVVVLGEADCFDESLILHSVPFRQSKPSGQQPSPHVGSGTEVFVEWSGDAGNLSGSEELVLQVMM